MGSEPTVTSSVSRCPCDAARGIVCIAHSCTIAPSESPQAPAPDPDFNFEGIDRIARYVVEKNDARGGELDTLARAYLALRVVPASGPEERDIEYLRMEESAFNALREAMHIATGEGWTHNFNPLEWVMVFYRSSRPAVPASGGRGNDLLARALDREIAAEDARRALASPAAAPRERTND